MFSLSGKTALVTGAARGLGKAMAAALAGAGARVVVNDIPAAKDDLEKVAAETKGFAVTANISREDEVTAMRATVLEKVGPIDILVNNAGINRDGLMKSASSADWESVLAVNLTGAFHCVKTFVNDMRDKRWGRVINIASVVGETGIIGTPYYAASKAGLIGLTKATAAEVARRGVTVNAIAPGYVDTQMTQVLPDDIKKNLIEQIAVGRFAKPEEIAACVVFLASEEAAYITGAVLNVNGGFYM